jgi:hypothetical protein
MREESKSHDFKLLFDPADEKAKIDHRVYRLYGLTAAEIQIVEGDDFNVHCAGEG